MALSFMDMGCDENDAITAAAALLPPIQDLLRTHRVPRPYRKAIRRAAKEFAKAAKELRRSGRAAEIGNTARMSLFTYRDLARQYNDPFIELYVDTALRDDERVGEFQREGALLDWIGRHRDQELVPDAGWAAMTTQYERSTREVSLSGADWPHRDQLGNPMLRMEVSFWMDAQRGWESAVLEARLSPGVMSKDPNLNVGVFRDEEVLVSAGHPHLLPRTDLAEPGIYEIRWHDPRESYEERHGLLRSDSPQLDLLIDYLNERSAKYADDPISAKFRDPTPRVSYPQ